MNSVTVPFELVRNARILPICRNKLFTARLLFIITFLITQPGISAFAQWSADPEINTSIAPYSISPGWPSPVAGQNNSVIIAWSDQPGNGQTGTIHAQRLNAAGEPLWGPTGISIPTAKTQNIAAAVTDGNGGIIIAVRQEERDPLAGVYADYYLQRITASGQIAWPVKGIPISQGVFHKGLWGLVPDKNGGAMFTWTEQHNSSKPILYVQHVTANGNMAWPPGGIAISSPLETIGFASLSLTSENNLVLAWGSHLPNEFSIRAQMIDADGNIKWKQGPVAVVKSNYGCDLPTIIPDGDKGAIIAWLDNRLGNGSAIYAQRINREGSIMWPADGVYVAREVGWQRGPQMVSDNAGGAIITWDDYRYGQQALNSHAQRINKNGVAQWTEHGVRLCPSPIRQYWTSIASDGLNGAFITWKDNRYGGAGDIYGQHVDSSGNLSWTDNGVVISSAQNGQSFPSIVSIQGNSAVIAWRDNRTFAEPEYGIFAQNVNLRGKLGCFTTHVTGQPISHQTVPLDRTPSELVVTTSGEVTEHQWFSNTTASMDGAISLYPLGTSASFVPQSTGEGTKYYYCRVSSSCDTIYSGYAEVKMVAAVTRLEVTISPNPSESFFNVTIKSPVSGKIEVRLYDMLGRLIEFNQGSPGDQFRIGESIAMGVYIIEASQGEEKLRRKIVKQ